MNFIFKVILIQMSLIPFLMGDQSLGVKDLPPDNLSKLISESKTGKDEVELSKLILRSENFELFKIALDSKLLPTVVDVAFQSENQRWKDYIVVSLLREQIKPWRWADSKTPQVLSGGMGADYISYADKCMKVLQKHFPNNSYTIEDFRDRELRLVFSRELEELLKLNLPEISDTRAKPKNRQRSRSELPSSYPNRVSIETDENGSNTNGKVKSNLPWIMTGAFLVGILFLLLKTFKGNPTS